MKITQRQMNSSNLSVAQKAVINGAMTAGGDLGVGLNEAQCVYLTARTAVDLGHKMKSIPATIQPFFGPTDLEQLSISDVAFLPLFEELVDQVPDAETYFECLASLHKRRLKYQRILEYQAIPNLNQVGPRGLLQYGTLNTQALAGWLFWRKWLFDIDNRAGQETGYIFEPIVARCVGGKAFTAKKSPIKRHDGSEKGRQVDCIWGERAYEIKLRVTVAASGQGRWGEEKDFPVDYQSSGYIPVLLVFDDTQAGKLDELKALFVKHGGETYVGSEAWQHLEELAGPTMSVFLELYVRQPLRDLLDNAPARERLPELNLKMDTNYLVLSIGEEKIKIARPNSAGAEPQTSEDILPEIN